MSHGPIVASDRDLPMRLDELQYKTLVDALQHRIGMFEVEERTTPNTLRKHQCAAMRRALGGVLRALECGEAIQREQP